MNKLPLCYGTEVIMSEMSEKYTRVIYTSHNFEKSEDYILPDSYPDVKNVLSCMARLAQLKTYYGSNSCELTATVIYNILFTSIDNSGATNLSSVIFKDEIKENIKYKHDNNTGIYLQTNVTQCNCRMANPRKFAIKTSLKISAFEDAEESVYPAFEEALPEDSDMQYFAEEADTLKAGAVTINDHSFSDNVELDVKSPEINNIVYWNADLIIRNEKTNDSISLPMKLKGNFAITAVCSDKEGKYFSFNKDIPFSVSLNDDEIALLSSAKEFTLFYPSARISAMNLNVGKNQYGENKVLEFDADYDIDLLMLGNKKINVITDAYSTKYSCNVNFNKITYLNIEKIHNGNLTCTGVNEVNTQGNIISCFNAGVSAEQIEFDSTNKLLGKIRTKAALICEDGNIDLREIQTSVVCGAENTNNGGDMFGDTKVTGVKLRCDNERLYTDSEVYFNLSAINSQNVSVCKSVSSFDSVNNKNSPAFSVYYPSKNESLWSTAKLKKTTVDLIKKFNPDYDSEYMNTLIIE